MKLNEITGHVIEAALKVHTALGPGLLEKAYRVCLVHELNKRGLRTAFEVWLPVFYDGVKLDSGYRLDILVQDEVVIELKATEATLPVFKAQLLSYLRLSGKKVGLLINFHAEHLRDGIRRVLNGDIPEEDVFPSGTSRARAQSGSSLE